MTLRIFPFVVVLLSGAYIGYNWDDMVFKAKSLVSKQSSVITDNQMQHLEECAQECGASFARCLEQY